MDPLKKKLADKWAGTECTIIDSRTGLEHRGRIVGRQNEFATVWALDDDRLDSEYTWATVDRVMNENEGRFVI